MNTLIAFDLELEQPKTNIQTPDSNLDHEAIIQVGWCVFNCENGEARILEENCENVKVEGIIELSKFIQKLTGITTEDVKNGKSLDTVYDMIVDSQKNWNASRVLRQWGGGDQEALKLELSKDLEWIFGRSGFNVKHLYQAYALANGLNTSGGLKKCMSRMNLKFEGKAHNALTDAINTAKIYAALEKQLKIV